MANTIGADDGANTQDQEGRGGSATMSEPDLTEDGAEAVDQVQRGGRDDQSIVSRDWVEAQGEGGGLDSQSQRDPEEPGSAEPHREADR